ncbi:hypothetical protein B0T09DRAFT_403551 [Sordaria sp. MPI-SDFR-AT-0083]|nr:hypothetical protein B0T09DRAFT_403551 [Sordaria sp. MPI-SDFR-AT-0083]
MAPKLESESPEATQDGNSTQGQIEAIQQKAEAFQQQVEDLRKAHLTEILDVHRRVATSQEEIKTLRKHTFARFCNFFTSGVQPVQLELPEEEWHAIIPHLMKEKPVIVTKLPLAHNFWVVDDTWGPERESYPAVASDGMLQSCLALYATLKAFPSHCCDWRNMALSSVRQVMKEMLSRGYVYKGLMSLITSMAVELVNKKQLPKTDPLLFAIWQVVGCADDMMTKSLRLTSQPRMFGEALPGDWADLARAIMIHTHTEAHKDIRPFGLVLQTSLKPDCVYYHTSKVGIIVDKDTESNQRHYIVLDFDTKRLRVVEGERWEVQDNGTMKAIR